MEKTKRKIPLKVFEVVILAIAIPVIFYASIRLLCEPLNKYSPHWFTGFGGILFILGFDCFWLILMKLWPLKILRIKVYMTLIVFVISLAILTCWVMLNALSGAMH